MRGASRHKRVSRLSLARTRVERDLAPAVPICNPLWSAAQPCAVAEGFREHPRAGDGALSPQGVAPPRPPRRSGSPCGHVPCTAGQIDPRPVRSRAAIDRALKRWTNLDVRDCARLLRLAGTYSVTELAVEDGDRVAGSSLAALSLRDEGAIVVGVLAGLDERRRGPEGDEARRRRAVARQQQVLAQQSAEEARRRQTAPNGGRVPAAPVKPELRPLPAHLGASPVLGGMHPAKLRGQR